MLYIWTARVIGSWWKDSWELEPRAAGLPEFLHAALHAANNAAESWPKQGAATHSRPAVSGQWSGEADWIPNFTVSAVQEISSALKCRVLNKKKMHPLYQKVKRQMTKYWRMFLQFATSPLDATKS